MLSNQTRPLMNNLIRRQTQLRQLRTLFTGGVKRKVICYNERTTPNQAKLIVPRCATTVTLCRRQHTSERNQQSRQVNYDSSRMPWPYEINPETDAVGAISCFIFILYVPMIIYTAVTAVARQLSPVKETSEDNQILGSTYTRSGESDKSWPLPSLEEDNFENERCISCPKDFLRTNVNSMYTPVEHLQSTSPSLPPNSPDVSGESGINPSGESGISPSGESEISLSGCCQCKHKFADFPEFPSSCN